MLNIRTLISIYTLLIISFSVSAENSFLAYLQQDIFWSNKYAESRSNNGELSKYRYKLLSDSFNTKENINPVVKINTLFNNKVTDLVFNSIPLEWDLLKQDNESWLVTNNKLISKSNSIALHKPLLISIQKPSFKDKWASILDYDELQVNYKTASNKQSCSVSAFLDFKGRPWNGKKGLLAPEERWITTYVDNQKMIEVMIQMMI